MYYDRDGRLWPATPATSGHFNAGRRGDGVVAEEHIVLGYRRRGPGDGRAFAQVNGERLDEGLARACNEGV
jgi:hypothetical protein